MSTQNSRKWEIGNYFMKILITFWRETLKTFYVTWITIGLGRKLAFYPCIIMGSTRPGCSVIDSLLTWCTAGQIVLKTLFLNVTFCIAWKREPWACVCYWAVSQLLLNVWLLIFISCTWTFWYRKRLFTDFPVGNKPPDDICGRSIMDGVWPTENGLTVKVFGTSIQVI